MRSLSSRLLVVTCLLWQGESALAEPPDSVRGFVQQHCVDCHSADYAEAGLDLTSLAPPEETPANFEKWVRIVDRIREGEMPPPEASELPPQQSARFLETAGGWLRSHQRTQYEALGRVRGRRLTNLQLERTLHDLLGIDIPLATRMPDEQRSEGFTTVADGQPMSHFQLEQHLAIVDVALDEAFRRATSPEEDTWSKTLEAGDIVRRKPKSRTREPELLDGQAVVWNGTVIYYGRIPATTAREDGWYRFTVRASALKSPPHGGVWCTVRSGPCVSTAPLLAWVGAFEAASEPQEWTFETWLPRGHMLEIRPGDKTLKRARFKGGQVGTGEGEPQNVPGVAIDSIVVERIHTGDNSSQIRQNLLGELEIEPGEGDRPTSLVSNAPHDDAQRLLERFAGRAFRRPVRDDVIAPYVEIAHQALDEGQPLLDALRGGYRALLCSPRFLYFHEEPGRLDDYALASRLSYFLASSMPDDELMRLATDGLLNDPQVLTEQVERLLSNGGEMTFIEDFAAQWLDLSEIDSTIPDRKLYPMFDFIVQHSLRDETHAFLENMLQDDLSVRHLIQSDNTWLNSRLARYYGIEGVTGDRLQQVVLKPQSHRGGLLTQGAILKVTANGTNTSPVIRGVWISERLLGVEIPPPPEGVAAVEPDIRGAGTIRELLAKHQSDASCASCHVKIDPPGFALENFDPAGQWREKYPRIKKGRRSKGADIDPGHQLPDGRSFASLEEFQQLIASRPEQLARNVAEKLITYGTGAPVGFADRQELESIVSQTAEADYGLRSLLRAVVTSEIFQSK